MGHYASEMMGDEKLTPKQQQSLDRYKLKADRDKALRHARVVGMTAAIEFLLRNSPLPIDLAYIERHLGLDGRGPEADAAREAVHNMLVRSENRVTLTGDHKLVISQ